MTRKMLFSGAKVVLSLSLSIVLVGLFGMVPADVLAKPYGQTNITDDITTDTTWTKANSPYILDQSIEVSEGATLTIEAGVEVQGQDGKGLTIKGTLNAIGTDTERIVFTSVQNTSGGQWIGLRFNGYSSALGKGTLDYVTVQYGGDYLAGYYANVTVDYGADVTITNSTIASSSNSGIVLDDTSTLVVEDSTINNNGEWGMYVNDVDSTLTLTGNTFDSNGEYPLRVYPDDVHSVTGNTFTNNTTNRVLVVGGSFDTNATWVKNDQTPYELQGTVTVNASAILTINAGVTVMGRDGYGLQVNGELKAVGTAAEPIVFTASGDSAAGQWAGLRFSGYSGNVGKGTLDYVTVRYGGDYLSGYYANMTVDDGSDVTITNSTIASSSASGMVLDDTSTLVVQDSAINNNGEWGIYVTDKASSITLTDNTFDGNGSYPLRVYPDDVHEVTGNTFTNNSPNRLLIAGGSFGTNITWSKNTLTAYELQGTVTVNAGAILTIEAGVTVMGRDGYGLQVNGQLVADGTATEPIVFTSSSDSGSGQWAGIRFSSYSGNVGKGTLDYVTVRYGGDYLGGTYLNIGLDDGADVTITNSTISSGSSAGIRVEQASNLVMQDSTISRNEGMGLYVHDAASTIEVTGNTFDANKDYPLRLFPEDVHTTTGNTFTDNTPNRLLIAGGAFSTDTTWSKNTLTAYELQGTVTVNTIAVLTIEAGVTVMGRDGYGLQVNGELIAQGTAKSPIMFTSTANNGSGQWAGINFSGYSGNVGKGTLSYVTVRYAGDYLGGLYGNIGVNDGADVTVSNSTIAASSAAGIYVADESTLVVKNSIISTNDGVGIYIYDADSSVESTSNTYRLNKSYPLRVYPKDVNNVTDTTLTDNMLDYILIAGGTLTADARWHYDTTVDAYELERTVTVNNETTLTIEPGVVVMGRDGYGLQVNGELSAIGQPANPIQFTSTVNNTGGQWAGLRFNGYSENIGKGTLRYVQVYHGGDSLDGVQANVGINRGADVSISHSTIDSSENTGVYLYQSTATITNTTIGSVGTDLYEVTGYGVYVYDKDSTLIFQNNTVQGCLSYPIRLYAKDMGYLNSNTFTGNGVNRVLVAGGGIDNSLTWYKNTNLEAYELENSVTVNTSGFLAIEPGVTVMGRDGRGIQVNGILSATGTLSDTILFTSAQDNGSGQWAGLRFDGRSGNVGRGMLAHVTIRYGGDYLDGMQANLGATQESQVIVRNSTISESVRSGVYGYNALLDMKCSVVASNEEDGILLGGSSNQFTGSSLAISNNDGMGLNNTNREDVDARYNWWGDPSGPGGFGPGSGDEISEYVRYVPWLDTHTCDLEDLVDLEVTKTASPEEVEMGKDLTYKVMVRNASPGDDMFSGVVMTDTLHPGLNFVSASTEQGTCSEEEAVVTCALGTLQSGDRVAVTIVVTSTVVGTVVNQAIVAADQPELLNSNNTASVSTDIIPSSDLPDPNAGCVSTIASVGSGDWDSPSTWSENRVPTTFDVVEIKQEHSVQIDTFHAGSSPMIYALCNYGKLQSGQNNPLRIHAKSYIYNFGEIRGLDGAASTSSFCGEKGMGVELRGSPIYNTNGAVIQAGAGGAGDQCGGDGGRTMVLGQNTTNLGTICGGKGGDVTGTGQGRGGHGGETHIWGKYRTYGGKLTNNGLACAGDGGNGNASATDAQRGGNGGRLKLISLPFVYLNDGKHYAGQGGNGTGGGNDGWNGGVIIEPSIISLSGSETEIRGGDVVIFGGNDWTLDMSNMPAGAVSASGSVTLAVGKGGTVDMSGNSGQVVQSTNGIEIASDTVILDEGTSLSDIAGSNVVTSPARILSDVSIAGPEKITADTGAALTIPLTILNSGPEEDTYTLSLSDTAGWGGDVKLASQVTVNGLDTHDVEATTTIPSNASEERNVITITATSQNDPSVTATTEIEVSLGSDEGIPPVYLPLVAK